MWVLFALIVTLLVPAVLAAAVAGAFATDHWVHEGQTLRNIALDGVGVGGLDEEDLRRKVELVAARYADTPIVVHLPDVTIDGTAAQFGVSVDVEATMAEAMAVGRSGDVAERFEAWARSLYDDHRIDLSVTFDPQAVYDLVAGSPHRVRNVPEEPTFEAVDGVLHIEPPVAGGRIAASDIVAAMPAAIEVGHNPITVEIDWTPIPTEVTQAELDAALAEARRMTSERIWVTVAGQPTSIAPETTRRWLRALNTGGELIPVFDEEMAQASVEAFTAGITARGAPPTFSVDDGGELQITLGVPSEVCCGPGVGELMWRAARGMIEQPVELPLVLANERGAQGEADEFGIKEVVGEFTTNHACCQARVTNIHRIADLVRGQIIEPGGSFSINDFVGKRTRENGFVSAGVIERGRFTTDVGGGISQFATTMFNAAFFAGLDLDEYQSHSIYISRYPYGREATMAFPRPDLVVSNPTPHPMLIWTSYTGSSITVQMWSTEYFEVEQTGQTRFGIGRCTGVRTFRSRTAPDGMVIEDFVVARYRPGEGLDCNGNPVPQN